MIEITGSLLARDYVRAQFLHMRPRLAYKILGIFILAAFIWATWYTFLGDDDPFVIADLILPAAFIYFMLFFFVYIPWKTRRSYEQRKDLQREQSMRFEESGLSARSEFAEGMTPWPDFLKWKENDHLFLLYISDCLYMMLPKRILANPEDVNRIRGILQTKIGQDAA